MAIKILHIMKSHNLAGAEKHVFDLLLLLNKKGYNTCLLNIFTKGEKVTQLYQNKIDALRSKGIKVYTIDLNHQNIVQVIRSMVRLINNISPDLVHTHMPYADLYGAIAAKLSNRVVVSTRHHDYSFSLWDRIKFITFYSVANLFHDITIAVSNNLKQLITTFEFLTLKQVEVVHHGCKDQALIKKESRKKIIEELNLPESSILLGTVARLIELKGHKFALEAFSRAYKKNNDIYWLIIGDGPEYQKLNSLVSKKKLNSNVIFLGYRSDIPTLMSAIDWLVHPTTSEAFGMVLVEAMMQKTPVIASEVGSIPEIIIDQHTGFIFPNKDVDTLSKLLEKISLNDNYVQDMGQNSRKRYESEFAIENMYQKTVSLYGNIMGRKKALYSDMY